MNKMIRFFVPFVIAFLFLGMLFWLVGASSRVTAATSISTTEGAILVTTLEDELNSDGDCSLREAIEAANTNMLVDACPTGNASITDTITFDITGTINVISQLEVMAGGPLVIDGGDVITTSGGGTTRVWWVGAGSQLALQRLKVNNGYTFEDGAGLYNNGGEVTINNITLSGNNAFQGGAIDNHGIISIISSTLYYNYAYYGGAIRNDYNHMLTITNTNLLSNNAVQGGGIDNIGSLLIKNSSMSDNSASYGGGIANGGPQSTITVTNSILSDNIASDQGGGIYNGNGTVFIMNSTLSSNNADNHGGGLYNYNGIQIIINSTLSSNSADYGGGIRNLWGTVNITNSTMNGNGATSGGSIDNEIGMLSTTNTIVANSISGGECLGTISDGGHNISSDDTCGFDPANGSLPNADPLLGLLQDNGGPTLTHALLPDSPAIDAGDDAQCPATDQRGVLRPLDGDGDGLTVCDIGSYEFEPGYLVVTTLEDELNTDDDCSLREAIEAANTNSEVDDCGTGVVLTDTITFNMAGTITLNAQLEVSAGGPLVIDGGSAITVSGAGLFRILYIHTDGLLELDSLNLTNGYAASGGGIYNDGALLLSNSIVSNNTGGGINNHGSLTILNSTLSDNFASYSGAGIANGGSMSIISSTLSGNDAEVMDGGGILNGGYGILMNCTLSNNSAHEGGGISNSGTLIITNSALSDNTANYYGGIINYNGSLTITQSTFQGNSARLGGAIGNQSTLSIINSTVVSNTSQDYGGGIYNTGMMDIVNSTLSENTAAIDGGGINSWSELHIINSTISRNSAAGNGGGIYNQSLLTIVNSTLSNNSANIGGNTHSSGMLTFTNSIVAYSLSGGDCVGTIIDGGHNISSDDTCGFDPANGSMPNTDPLLGPLQGNSGPTWTHALLSGSPAIDSGDDTQCPPTDQRGVPRPLDGNGDGTAVCDIGSYEHEPGQLVVTTLNDIVDPEDELCSLREALQAANTNSYIEDCGTGDLITDTITFNVSGTITVASQLEVTAGGPLVIDGEYVITLNGGGTSRVFDVQSGSKLSLNNLAVRNGSTMDNGAGLLINTAEVTVTNSILTENHAGQIEIGSGGGIYLQNGDLTIIDSAISGNSANIYGGAIYLNTSTAKIIHSSITGNSSAWESGGGIHMQNSSLLIISSTISANNAQGGFGGGINMWSSVLTITESVVSGNTAFSYGGGIAVGFGTLALTNSTISSNSSTTDPYSCGGGIYIPSVGSANIVNTTITGNGIYGYESNGGGICNRGNATLVNSIIANSPAGGDCSGLFIDGGHNLDSDDSCGLDPINGSLPGIDPLLGSLQNNGGPTWTHALLPGSPAIDAGDDAQCPTTDQRGVLRPLDGDNDGVEVCDIGSYEREYQPVAPVLVEISGVSEGYLGQVTYFTAAVEPVSSTLPIEYVWEASGRLPITETGGLTDTVGWAWEAPGTYAITVTASNLVGSVTDTHTITITEPLIKIYIPLVTKSSVEPIGYLFSLFLPGSGMRAVRLP